MQLLATGAAAPDTTPPTITSANTDSVVENATLSHALIADETVTWSIVGGADQTKFEISGSTLRWASNGTKNYESPDDSDTDNAYVVTVRATDLASNTTDQTITVTVTDAVEFVASSGTTYATGTSQNQTIPASAQTDDMLIAVIMHRDTLTPPAGWTLVDSVGGVATGLGITQTVSLYKRLCQIGDPGASTTWSQATSQRICVHIMAFRKTSGAPSVVDHDTAHTDNTASTSQAMAASTATADGQMGVTVASSVLANTSPTTTTLTPSVGTQTTTATVADNRLCAAYLARNNTQTTAGTVTSSQSTLSTGAWAAVSLVIG